MSPRISHPMLLWVALALVGLVVAIGVSYAASQLSKPTVGLASEPISRVSELAPKSARGKDTAASSPPTTTTAPPSAAPPTAPLPDDTGESGDD